MRRITKAVQKQTINDGDPSAKLNLVPQLLERAGRDAVLGLLSKYIVFKDHRDAYWTDRYWYFDVEQYEKDLSAFGVDVAMALREPMRLPEP